MNMLTLFTIVGAVFSIPFTILTHEVWRDNGFTPSGERWSDIVLVWVGWLVFTLITCSFIITFFGL